MYYFPVSCSVKKNPVHGWNKLLVIYLRSGNLNILTWSVLLSSNISPVWFVLLFYPQIHMDNPNPLLCFLYYNTTLIQQPYSHHNLTWAFTYDAKSFITEHSHHPFFLYFSFAHMHTDMFAAPKFQFSSRRGKMIHTPCAKTVPLISNTWSIDLFQNRVNNAGLGAMRGIKSSSCFVLIQTGSIGSTKFGFNMCIASLKDLDTKQLLDFFFSPGPSLCCYTERCVDFKWNSILLLHPCKVYTAWPRQKDLAAIAVT